MRLYTPPTGLEVRALLSRWELSGSQAGALVDVTGRTVRRWTGDDRQMDYSALFTMARKCQNLDISRENWRAELDL